MEMRSAQTNGYLAHHVNGCNGAVNGVLDNNFTQKSSNSSSPISVVMFPWVGHGHITPFLELAKKLSKRNFTIFLCSTPVNLCSIQGNLDEKYADSINLIELNLRSTKAFPPYLHTTNGLPPNLMSTLKDALDEASPDFVKILEKIKPDVLIHDFLQPWAGDAAREMDIPAIDFISSSATMTSIMYHVFCKKQGNDFPFWSNIMKFRDYEQHCMEELEAASKRRSKDDMRAIESIEKSTDIVLIKSFKEIEGKYCDYLSMLSSKKFVPVGPLVQEPSKVDVNDKQSSRIMEWLNKKKQGLTVFVSFGSEYFLSKKDMEEISYGLELSKVNFLWVLRAPKGEVMNFDEALPDGFLKRVGDRGLMVEGWAPQSRILQHESIGGFVSHCGWNSVIEGMTFGVPIIAMPMHLDQPINARLVEEIGMGLEVVRDEKGMLQRNEMANVIDTVMIDEDSKKLFRKKASDMRDLIRSKGEEEIDNVVMELINISMKMKKGSLA